MMGFIMCFKLCQISLAHSWIRPFCSGELVSIRIEYRENIDDEVVKIRGDLRVRLPGIHDL